MTQKPNHEELEKRVRFPEESASGHNNHSKNPHNKEDLYRDIKGNVLNIPLKKVVMNRKKTGSQKF